MMNSSESVRRHTWADLAVPGMVLCGLALAGCGATRTSPPVQATNNDLSVEAEPGVEPAASADQADERPPREDVFASAAENPADADATEPLVLEPVGPQDARRGKTITGGGIITEPLRQHFLIQHRIVFEISVKQAEQLYRAEHGRMPRSHEEYITEIIEKNGIQLPELDSGWDYYYDATDEQLKKRNVQ
jgi:hypothetical protein